MYFILFGLIYAWSTYIWRLMCVKISLVKFTNGFPLFWPLSFILPTALSFAILRPFSEAGWKIRLLQFDYKEMQRVTSSRRICSDLPIFTVCINRNKCRESCSNRCIKNFLLFLHLHQEIVTAISRWSKTFVCLRVHWHTLASWLAPSCFPLWRVGNEIE